MDWYKKRKGQTHYPVPGNFTAGKRAGQKHRELRRFYICMHQCRGRLAVDGNQGWESRIKLPVSTRRYIRASALKSPVYLL